MVAYEGLSGCHLFYVGGMVLEDKGWGIEEGNLREGSLALRRVCLERLWRRCGYLLYPW